MTEQEALARMVAPGTRRAGKYREGVIQVWVTRACDKSCFACTQGSNLAGAKEFITVDQFRAACRSLKGYFGVVGMFGGNPALHPQFEALCQVMAEEVPLEQRGIWCNNPITVEKAAVMRRTFTPGVSNINVHLDLEAARKFREGWPEVHIVGLTTDSRHSPVHLAMKDVVTKVCEGCGGLGDDNVRHEFNQCPVCRGTGRVPDNEHIWELVSNCDINKHWSAMIGVFRGELRAWFCEVAGAQAMLHQHEEDYPDTGLDPTKDRYEYSIPVMLTFVPLFKSKWWELPMWAFQQQVRKHCFECGVPLRGYGELSQAAEGKEQTTQTHLGVFVPKRKGREVELVGDLQQLGTGRLAKTTDYIGNAKR